MATALDEMLISKVARDRPAKAATARNDGHMVQALAVIDVCNRLELTLRSWSSFIRDMFEFEITLTCLIGPCQSRSQASPLLMPYPQESQVRQDEDELSRPS